MDILDEIQGDVRRAELQNFIKRYYKALIALLIIFAIVVSSWLFFRQNRISKQQEMAKQYYELFISNKRQGPLTDIAIGELTKFTDSIFMPFAEFEYVNRAIENKQYDRAVTLLLDIITSKKNPLELSNAARIKLTEVVMAYNMKEYYAKVSDILVKAIKHSGAPYVHIMQLLLGQLLIQANRVDEGRAVLTKLNKDVSTPEGVRFFCEVILGNYL
jgi:predicted negative regulator of RcsB-dependent stress response